MHVALYLTYLLNNGSPEHPVSNAVYGIKWAHEINGLDDPTKNSFVTSIQEAAKRVAHKKTDKKDPITTETLIELCEMHKDSSDLHVIRDLTMILLCFAGFLRYDDVSSSRVIDFDIDDSFLALHINKSKTDQYRQSNEVLISKGSTCACPFNMFIRYKNLASLSISSREILLRPIYRSGKVCRLIKKDKKLSYTAARESLLKRLMSICPEANIGLHSLRSGGTTVAANTDVSDRCLKTHGRW